jgi:molybdopterin molybdotransferase
MVAGEARPLAPEPATLDDAAGRVLADPAHAVVDLPPFDRSAMDGFAVRAGDTAGMPLRLVGTVAAGDVAPPTVTPGTTVDISTGAPLPPGADAVLRSELTKCRDGVVIPLEGVPPRRYVRVRGEDVRAGAMLAPAGAKLTVQRLASLASAGVGTVRVHRRARVHLVVNGDELQLPGTPPRAGAIYESNGLIVRRLAGRAGARIHDGGIVGDDADAVRRAVTSGLSADVLVVSGGISVGPHDHVKAAFAACGVRELFWGVRVKPGKPLWFGRRGDTLVFGLPGNPLSTLVGLLLFVEPALRRLQGEPGAAPRPVPARLTASVAPDDGRTTLLTARVVRATDGTLLATPTQRQGSHMTGALGDSDGFVIVPHDLPRLSAGSAVRLLLPDELPTPAL